jgi:hypothetical protein
MAPKNHHPGDGKLSPQFKARLNRLGTQHKVRAILLLGTKLPEKAPGRRADRRTAISAVHRSAERSLVDIDAILERYGGHRLAPAPDALGSIPVETTVDGITALAGSDHVKAILEDQAISLLPSPKRSF